MDYSAILTAMIVADREAKRLYDEHTDNHPTIHSNRFPAWDELSESQKNEWRRKTPNA